MKKDILMKQLENIRRDVEALEDMDGEMSDILKLELLNVLVNYINDEDVRRVVDEIALV